MKKCKPAANYRAARRNEWRKGDLIWWAAFANHDKAARYIPPSSGPSQPRQALGRRGPRNDVSTQSR